MNGVLRRKCIRLVSALGLAVTAMTVPAGLTHAADPPPNDLFANATPVTLDFVDTVDTTMATTGEDEDFAAKEACDSPPFDSDAPPDATVWYSLTVDETVGVGISAAPPTFVTPGFNVVVDTGEGFECVAGGPVEVLFQAEPGVTYYVQSIDDQIPPGFPEEPLDTAIGGELTVSFTALGPPICPGIFENDPRLPPGLNVIVGTDDKDVIDGTPGDDLILGLEGNDLIRGHGGNDFIFGCAGDDQVEGNAGDDFVIGDSADFFGMPESTSGGDDRVFGGSGNDDIRGGPGDDYLNGGSGDDGVFGNQGDDDIRAGTGNDFAVGGFGNDIVRGQAGDDEVYGGFDSDTVLGGSGADLVNGDVPAPIVDESEHSDRCFGGPGPDTVENCERP